MTPSNRVKITLVTLLLLALVLAMLVQWQPGVREWLTVQQYGVGPAVYDVNGQRQSWAWLVGKYPGTLWREYSGSQTCVYRLRDVRETSGPTTVVVRVYDQQGAPQVGAVVGLYWKTASPRIVVPNDNTRWYDYVGAAQVTDSNGHTGFGLGPGGIYGADGGPHAVWVLSHLAGSDALDRFGWLPLTNHDGPLSLDFQLSCEQLTPTPEPTATPPEPTPGWVRYDLSWGPFTLPIELRRR